MRRRDLEGHGVAHVEQAMDVVVAAELPSLRAFALSIDRRAAAALRRNRRHRCRCSRPPGSSPNSAWSGRARDMMPAGHHDHRQLPLALRLVDGLPRRPRPSSEVPSRSSATRRIDRVGHGVSVSVAARLSEGGRALTRRRLRSTRVAPKAGTRAGRSAERGFSASRNGPTEERKIRPAAAVAHRPIIVRTAPSRIACPLELDRMVTIKSARPRP